MPSAKDSTGLQFSSALSTKADTSQAIDEVCRLAAEKLEGTPDLAVVFVSQHHGPDFAAAAKQISRLTKTACLVGCSGESIVGTGREVEEAPALSLWLARMPGVSIAPMHLEFERTPEGGTFVGWPDELPEVWPEGSTLLVLGEPFSFPADVLLARLNEDRPKTLVMGGMASGGHSPGECCVMLGDKEFRSGAAAVLLDGPVSVKAVVSQGCRPIGRHYVVTKAEQNVIFELSGKPPLEQFQELFGTLSQNEKQLVEQGLHVGQVINEYQDKFGRGDFLVRNVVGADRNSGAIAIGDFVRVGQTVQFHLRDAQSADEELRELLTNARDSGGQSPAGALMFTCNGRGTRLFREENHDAGAVQHMLGEIPLAGFFAQGEIGPIGGRSFLHGFTASIALFSPRP